MMRDKIIEVLISEFYDQRNAEVVADAILAAIGDGEAVYMLWDGNDWKETTKHFYDMCDEEDRNILYSTPRTPPQPYPAVSFSCDVTPEMLKAAQTRSELGEYACANLSGAYSLITEMFNVMFKEWVVTCSNNPKK